jgi:hypothetical protein
VSGSGQPGRRRKRGDHSRHERRGRQLRHNLWPYDAAYVALAESLRTTLITVDAKLGDVPDLQCPVWNIRDARRDGPTRNR